MAGPIFNLSTLNGSNGFRLDGTTAEDASGRSVSNAGDVNGDGFDDVIVGAPGVDLNGKNSGASYVVFGRASGFSTAMNLSSLNGSNGFRLNGVAELDSSGFSVSNAGDVNGDGFDDLIIGAPGANSNKDDSGSSFVVFGKASGFSAAMNLSDLNGENGFRIIGEGSSVGSAGDINGDGFDDVIVGGPNYRYQRDYYSGWWFATGDSYVVFGKSDGFDPTLDVANLDGNNGFKIPGIYDESLGNSVSTAGDVNGDGLDDLIVGSLGTKSNFVVFGKASGFSSVVSLTNLDGSNGFRIQGSAREVSNAGDVNGDGYDDLIIDASYVLFGKAEGFDSILDLSTLNGRNGFNLIGAEFDALTSSTVSGGGDVNGDGYADLVIGAPGADRNGDQSGSSYVVFGGEFFSTDIFIGTSDDDILTGSEVTERFEGGDGNDRMIGMGGADVFHGGVGNDTIAVLDLHFQLADGGPGNDTLELAGRDINLKLSDMSNKISGIETIDLTGIKDNFGNDNNTLTLTLSDLLNLSDTTDTFTVNGNPGDRVVGLVDGWVNGGFEDNYHIYTNQGAVLRMDTSVSTDITTGVLSLGDLDGNNGFRLDGVAAYDSSGCSVSNAGDVNGDGIDDVIVGAYGANANGPYSGSSYVVFGRASGFDAAMNLSSLDGINGFRLDGTAGELSGRAVSGAGDLNGDGFDDVIIGASSADPNGELSGSSYVVFGNASGFDATMNLASLNGSNGFRLDGVAKYDISGVSVSSTGDVNGDGFDDVIIGALGVDSNGNYSGASYIVFGKASGFDAAMNLSSLDGNNGFRLDGAAYDSSGSSVSNAGDVNGDDFDDVIVSAESADPNGYSSGSSYVVFGKDSGFDASMNLSSLDGTNGFRLDGEAENDSSGRSVSTAGDVNGDGFDDLIVGALGSDRNGDNSGSSYVVFGKALGFDAQINLSNLDGTDGFRLDGAEKDDKSGRSVSTAGDINGDGFDDLIVGAYSASPGGVDFSGSSYVVFGKASGFDASMNLSNLDGINGFRLDGEADNNLSGDLSGGSVSTAGDVNGDGFDDLIVGATYTNTNGTKSGSSYVIFGRNDFSGAGITHPGTPGNDNLIGTSTADIFDAGDGNDNMIGRGGADVFHAGAGDDNIRVFDLNFQLIEGGIGNDTLHLTGKDLNLDLSSLGDKISDIETICLYGNGDNVLTVTEAGLINLSDSTNILKVNGNAGDHIMGLSSDWTDNGLRGEGYFHVYTQGDAVVLVGENVTTDFPVI